MLRWNERDRLGVWNRVHTQDGKADCKIVETSFGKLEQVEQQQPTEDNQQPDQQDQ